MWGILIKIGIVIGAILLFYFLGAFLSLGVRKPLAEICLHRGLSASPWKFFLWEGVIIYEFFTETLKSTLLDKTIGLGFVSSWYYTALLILLFAIPIFVLLVKAKLFFIPLLLIKVLCIPLDILYVATGCYKDSDYTPVTESDSSGSNFSGRSQTGRSRPFVSHTLFISPFSASRDASNQGYSETPYHGQYEPQPTIHEKYQDQEYTRQGSDESYHTADIGGKTAYYNGDYAPFNESGGDVEIRTYDSDYSPMD